ACCPFADIAGFPTQIPFPPEFTSRTLTTPVAPFMPNCPQSQITSMGLLTDKIDQRVRTEVCCQFPGCSLVQPHQRGLQNESSFHSEVQSNLDRFDRVVAAIWISGIICFTHSAYDVL